MSHMGKGDKNCLKGGRAQVSVVKQRVKGLLEATARIPRPPAMAASQPVYHFQVESRSVNGQL